MFVPHGVCNLHLLLHDSSACPLKEAVHGHPFVAHGAYHLAFSVCSIASSMSCPFPSVFVPILRGWVDGMHDDLKARSNGALDDVLPLGVDVLLGLLVSRAYVSKES